MSYEKPYSVEPEIDPFEKKKKAVLEFLKKEPNVEIKKRDGVLKGEAGAEKRKAGWMII